MDNIPEYEDPNSHQVGGSHYKPGQWMHWDWCELNEIGYLEAVASKYILRWKYKDDIQDLNKAVHYIEKLHNLAIFKKRKNRRNRELMWSATRTEELINIYQCKDTWAEHIVRGLLYWNTPNDLWSLRQALSISILRLVTEGEKV